MAKLFSNVFEVEEDPAPTVGPQPAPAAVDEDPGPTVGPEPAPAAVDAPDDFAG